MLPEILSNLPPGKPTDEVSKSLFFFCRLSKIAVRKADGSPGLGDLELISALNRFKSKDK